MNCIKCNAQLPEGSMFCANCGAEQPAAPTPTPSYAPQPSYDNPPPAAPSYGTPYGTPYRTPAPAPKKKKLLPIICVVAAVVVVVVLLIVLLSGGSNSSPEAVVEEFYESLCDNDLDAVEACFHEKVLEEEPNWRDSIDNSLDSFALLDSFDLTTTGSDAITGIDLDDIQEFYDDNYGLDVSAASDVSFDLTLELFGESVTESGSTIAVEIDGDWYIHSIG